MDGDEPLLQEEEEEEEEEEEKKEEEEEEEASLSSPLPTEEPPIEGTHPTRTDPYTDPYLTEPPSDGRLESGVEYGDLPPSLAFPTADPLTEATQVSYGSVYDTDPYLLYGSVCLAASSCLGRRRDSPSLCLPLVGITLTLTLTLTLTPVGIAPHHRIDPYRPVSIRIDPYRSVLTPAISGRDSSSPSLFAPYNGIQLDLEAS